MSPSVRVGRGATYLFLSSIITTAIGLVYFLVIYHTLTKEDTGVYTLLTITIALVQTIGVLSLPAASIKYISQYLAEGNREKAKSVVTRVIQLSLGASTAAMVLLFISAEWLSTTISGTTANLTLFRLVAFNSFFVILYLQTIGFLQGLQKMGTAALMTGGYTSLQSAIGIYLVLSGWGLVGVVLSWLIVTAIGFATGLILTLKHLGFSKKPHPIKPLLHFSYPLYIAGIIGILATYMDSILLFSYMNAAHGLTEAQQLLGIYNIAFRASFVPTMLSTAIATALFPQLSELYTQRGMQGLKDACKITSRYSVLVSFPVIIGLAVLASPIVILFGGWDYRAAGLPLTVLCLAAIPVAVGVALGSTLMTVERTKSNSLITIISIIATSTLTLANLAYFYPLLGLTGPAWARIISSLVGFGLTVYAVKKVFSVSFDMEALWKASAASFIMIVAILLLDVARQVLTPAPSEFLLFPLRLLPLYIIVGAGAYFFSLSALKTIKRPDIELFQEYLPSSFKRIVPLLERLTRVD